MAKKTVTKETHSDYWFPAKKYGLGWGLPIKKQGWFAFLGLLTAGVLPLIYVSVWYKGDTYCQAVIDQGINAVCDPYADVGVYVMAALFWLAACILLLVHICNKKGEPTSWRWGDKTHAKKS